VIRGGFGITYDRINTDVIADAISNLPNVSTPRLVYGNLADIPGLRNQGGTSANSNAWGVDRSGNLPTVYITVSACSVTWAGRRRWTWLMSERWGAISCANTI
jgi:hypothetical protein